MSRSRLDTPLTDDDRAFVCSCLLLYYRTALNHAGLALSESAAVASLKHLTPLTILTYIPLILQTTYERLTSLSYVELAVGVSCSCMPAVSTILRHYLPSYGTIKARVSAVIHLSAAVKDTTEKESSQKQSSDSSLEGHLSQKKAASGNEIRETQRTKRTTKVSQDIEKQYPVEEDEMYLMDDHGSCKSQHSTPVNPGKQHEIGVAY